MGELKRTPLFPFYSKLGAKTIDFGGWDLPVQFSGIIEEHENVRSNVGLFDVSHMGEIEVKGKDSLAFLQKVMTNDVSKLVDGKIQYTAMCYENGGTVDDLLIYRKSKNDYLLVVNAANIEKDEAWLCKHCEGEVEIVNISTEVAQVALQGPKAASVLQTFVTVDLSQMKPFTFLEKVTIKDIETLISRTGYTGEDGFEIYCQKDDVAIIWNTLLEVGSEMGIKPIGLGARDTLRFEAVLPLYGQELGADITPVEAGISFAVKVNKPMDFIGKEVLKEQVENGPKRKLVGIEMIDKGIPRTGYDVFYQDEKVGHITTGTQSPTLKKAIGLALLDISATSIGEEIEVDIRNKRKKAKIINLPFYRRK